MTSQAMTTELRMVASSPQHNCVRLFHQQINFVTKEGRARYHADCFRQQLSDVRIEPR
jgi:hypothetical protein